MPQFKTTYNILKVSDEDEAFDKNWFESDQLRLPPKSHWDYKRDLFVEDVDYWEVLYEASGGIGFYAAWCPYAEFYMITTGFDVKHGPQWRDKNSPIPYWDKTFETYYGPGAEYHAVNRAKDFGIVLNSTQIWVHPDDMWLHTKPDLPEDKKIIILP